MLSSVDQQYLEAVQVRGDRLSEEVHRSQQPEEAHQEPQQGGAGAGAAGQGEHEGEAGPADCGGRARHRQHLGDGGARDDEPLPGREPQPHVRGRSRHLRLDQEGGGGEILPLLQHSSLPRGLNSTNKHFLS